MLLRFGVVTLGEVSPIAVATILFFQLHTSKHTDWGRPVCMYTWLPLLFHLTPTTCATSFSCLTTLGWKQVVSHLKPSYTCQSKTQRALDPAINKKSFTPSYFYFYHICVMVAITWMSLLCTSLSSSSGGTPTTWLERPITSWYLLHVYKMFNVFSLPLLPMNRKGNQLRT